MDCARVDELALEFVDPDDGDEPPLSARVRRELDEHLVGCARCKDLLSRLRRGLEFAEALPKEEPSALLEARILAAAAASRRPEPARLRLVRAMSAAGGWAMRPQVAMAAVFLLMVGTSVALLRGGRVIGRTTTVTEEGTPIATLELPSQEPGSAPAVVVSADKPATAPPRDQKDEKPREPLVAAPAVAQVHDGAGSSAAAAKGAAARVDDEFATVPGTAPAAHAPTGPGAKSTVTAELGPEGLGGADGKADLSKKSAAPKAAPDASSAYDDAMAAYKEGRYLDAAKGFETAAVAGLRASSAWLHAARAHRAAGACAQALPRFQRVVTGYAGTVDAAHAALEGGQCAKVLGDPATARGLFERARTSSATQKQADVELAALAAPAVAAPPAKAKATKSSTAADSTP